MADDGSQTLLTLTADIVASHVANNKVSPSDLGPLISNVHQALESLTAPPAEPAPALVPAVSIRASVKPDHIVCLEDGKKMRMLKRHLANDHHMTPAEYRAKWGLPDSYPMVAPSYSDQRRTLAKQIGLGTKANRGASGKRGSKK